MKRWIALARAAAPCITGMLFLGFASNAANAASCQQGDRQLPLSKLCTSQVEHLLPPPQYAESLANFGCRPVITDGTILGQVFVYYTSECEDDPATLEGGNDVWGRGLSPDFDANVEDDYGPIVKVLRADPEDPTGSMMRLVRQSLRGSGADPSSIQSDLEKCRPRPAPDFGPDAWVVDEYSADEVPQELDFPRYACGTYGYDGETSVYWRIAHGLAIFFKLGSGVYKDLDPQSVTMIAKGADGHYYPVKDVMHQAVPVAVPSALDNASPTEEATVNHTVTRIADVPGSVETAYGTTRGWSVFAGSVDGRFSYCVGQNRNGDITLRLGSDGTQWQVAVPTTVASASFNGFEVDGQSWDMSGSVTDNWTFGWISNSAQVDAIGNGDLMMMDIGRASIDFPLNGTAAVILKVQECLQNRGRRS